MEISVEDVQSCVGEWVLECRARDRVIAGLQAENAALRAQLEPPVDPEVRVDGKELVRAVDGARESDGWVE